MPHKEALFLGILQNFREKSPFGLCRLGALNSNRLKENISMEKAVMIQIELDKVVCEAR